MLKRRLQAALARNSLLRCSSARSLLLLRLASQTADAAASTRSLLRTRHLRTQDLDVTRDDDETLADFDTLLGLHGDVGSHLLDAEAAARDLHGHSLDVAGIAGNSESPAGALPSAEPTEPSGTPLPRECEAVPREVGEVSVVPRLLYVTPAGESEMRSRVRIFNHSLRALGFAVGVDSRGECQIPVVPPELRVFPCSGTVGALSSVELTVEWERAFHDR